MSGMKIDTMETKGMKFSGEVGAPAAQWVPLCHKLLPPTPPHPNCGLMPPFSAASAAAARTGYSETREAHAALTFVNEMQI